MRLKEFAAPKTASKPAPKDANAIEAETIKRQQQTRRAAAYQAKAETRALNNTGNPSPKSPAH
jgi:hypothetical protein